MSQTFTSYFLESISVQKYSWSQILPCLHLPDLYLYIASFLYKSQAQQNLAAKIWLQLYFWNFNRYLLTEYVMHPRNCQSRTVFMFACAFDMCIKLLLDLICKYYMYTTVQKLLKIFLLFWRSALAKWRREWQITRWGVHKATFTLPTRSTRPSRSLKFPDQARPIKLTWLVPNRVHSCMVE